MNKRMTSAALQTGSSVDAFTDVELIWIEKTVEHWIRFGVADREVFLDRHRRILSFRPGSVLARVRWSANAYGTVVSRLDIFGAPQPGQACQTLPLVDPGGVVLLQAQGWPRVERVLRIIDAVEAAGIDPAEVAPDHWRHVHNSLAAGEQPCAYTPVRHRAWLKRRRVRP